MEFWKMNGAGNDFILLNNLKEHLPEEAFPDIARTLCERLVLPVLRAVVLREHEVPDLKIAVAVAADTASR